MVLLSLRTTSVRKYAREDCLSRCSPGKAAALLFQLTITGHKDTSKRVERFFGGQQYLGGIAAALVVCSSTSTTVGDALHVLEIRLPLRSHFTREKDANRSPTPLLIKPMLLLIRYSSTERRSPTNSTDVLEGWRLGLRSKVESSHHKIPRSSPVPKAWPSFEVQVSQGHENVHDRRGFVTVRPTNLRLHLR